MYLAPRWALSAQAIDSATDPRLAKGIHVRAMVSDRLGLPLAPLVVYRLTLSQIDALSTLRTDVHWVDSHGATLTAPFTVTPDNPVTGWLPSPPTDCCWIEVQAKASAPAAIRPPSVAVIPSLAGVASTLVAHASPKAQTALPVLSPAIASTIARLAPIRSVLLTSTGGLQVDAVVATRRGPAVVATRRAAPYQLGASTIEQVIVHGSGTVTGARWVDANSLTPSLRWRQWSLPVAGGPRYLADPNAVPEAKARVLAGAPLLHALYEAPAAASSATAPPATPTDEQNRVAGLAGELVPWLQRLVSDTSAAPSDLTQPFTFTTSGTSTGSGNLPLLGAVLEAGLDPGLARLMGFADLDTPLPGAAGDVTFYFIQGVWSADPKRIPAPLRRQIPPDAVFDPTKIPVDKRLGLSKLDGQLTVTGPCVELWAVAAATIGVPGDPPLAPLFDPVEEGPWMPSPPTAPERQLGLPVHGLAPAAAIALARQDSTGLHPLNPLSQRTGKPLPLVASAPKVARTSGQGHFEDRHAPAEGPEYRIAQSDWFGRWSDWGVVNAPAEAPPPPPRPTLELFYTPPAITAVGSAAGSLLARVQVPSDSQLPPGCPPLTQLRITAQAPDVAFTLDSMYPVGGGVPSVVLIPATAPTPPATSPAPTPAMLAVTFSGPALAVAQSTTMTVTAYWLAGTSSSAPSDPIRRFVGDPRPAPPPPLDPTLRYSAKPDATGRSRFELSLPTAAGVKYRVYYADENQLLAGLAHLRDGHFTDPSLPADVASQAGAALTDLNGAAALDAAHRAARFVSYASLYTLDMFQNLTVTAFPGPSFTHDLSGSLKPLSFYRVLTWNASNVPSAFATSPLLPVAVPNDGPPAQPMISAAPLPPTAAQITVRVPRNAVAPVQYRVRRSLAPSSGDPRGMLIVYEGALPTAPASPTTVVPSPTTPSVAMDFGRDATTFAHTDLGPLQSWRRYAWAVEVRGGPPIGAPAGTTIAGDYSAPSKPASALIVPSTPPDAVASISAVRYSGTTSGVTVQWTTTTDAFALLATDLGPHQFVLYRWADNQRPAVVPTSPAPVPVTAADGTVSLSFNDDGAPSPVSYRLVVVDPLGRTSRPSAIVRVV